MPAATPGGSAKSDLYAQLGVPPDATYDQIIRAYRRAARAIHPDADAGNPEAAERFERLAAARDVLTDPTRRAAYDRVRQAVPPPAPPLPSATTDRPGRATRPPRAAVRPGPVIWIPDRTPRGRQAGRPKDEPW